jgi:small-conductance mechanosensitive channel
VAYFFLIGRYGVRSGDRVTISGVTGNVIEIGLVRIYLAELAGPPGDLHPTGRIVVYSNSVLFQPSALFKQLPGTDYVWHAMRMVLTPESDFQLAESRITEAVNGVYQQYRHVIEQQHANFERAVDSHMDQPQPEVRLHFIGEGLEVTVRYPAQIKAAALTDDQVRKALQEAVAREPGLELASSGSPKLVAEAA